MRSRSAIIPAVFNDNPAIFKERLEFAEKASRSVHFDVLDGIFCKGDLNLDLTAWPKFNVEYSEVHLMVKQPLEYLERVKSKKITRAIVPVEADYDLDNLRQKARELDLLLGFSINPDTDLTEIKKFLFASNYIQVMGVHPGLTGQKMLETTIPAISYLKRTIRERLYITVDGGVTLENSHSLIKAGANYLVATTAIFSAGDPEENYQKLLESINVD